VTLPNGFRPLPAPVRPVQQRLNNGTSLAQIAFAHAKATLDAQVAAGKLTAAQEAALLARLQAATAALVGGGHS
jgi:Flp pilus assembly CpaF family ATPase